MIKRKRSKIAAPPRKPKRSVARRVVANQPPAVAAYPEALLDAAGLAIPKLGSWKEWRGLGSQESVRAVYHGQAARALDAYRAWIVAGGRKTDRGESFRRAVTAAV
jgi:hypothetical protein